MTEDPRSASGPARQGRPAREPVGREPVGGDPVGGDPVASCPVPLLELDGTLTCRGANDALLTLLGEAPERLLGVPWSAFLHPDDVAAVVRAVRTSAGLGTPEVVEHVVRRHDGAWTWVSAEIRPTSTSGRDLRVTVALTSAERLKHLEGRVVELSSLDSLTGLTNRSGTLDAVFDALRACPPESTVILAVVDIDRFSTVNSSLGHEAGDVLLSQVARRLSRVVDDCDIVGRVGNDEFLLCRAPAAGAPGGFGRAVAAAFDEPFDISGADMHVDASIGLVVTAETRITPERLLARGEDALRMAKARAGTTLSLFDGGRASRHSIRCELELDMNTGDLPDELVVCYQPIVATTSRIPVAVEALVRWNHPTRGLLAPDRFIELAHRTGHTGALMQSVLVKACTQAARWERTEGLRAPAVAVNASPADVVHRGFVGLVVDVLAETGLDPTRLHVELTESCFLEDPDAAVATLEALAEMGIGLSIDDFGTGYSSLSHLAHLPVSAVKIDRSFVAALDSTTPAAQRGRNAVRGITELGHSLGLDVVAEGIETPAQLAEVEALGVDFTQGFVHCRPLEASDPSFRALLASER